MPSNTTINITAEIMLPTIRVISSHCCPGVRKFHNAVKIYLSIIPTKENILYAEMAKIGPIKNTFIPPSQIAVMI